MASYRIEVTATAEKRLRKIRKEDLKRIILSIRKLAIDPRPRGSRRLRGYENVYRIRVKTYRIIYSIEQKRVLIIILKVGHRKDAYRS